MPSVQGSLVDPEAPPDSGAHLLQGAEHGAVVFQDPGEVRLPVTLGQPAPVDLVDEEGLDPPVAVGFSDPEKDDPGSFHLPQGQEERDEAEGKEPAPASLESGVDVGDHEGETGGFPPDFRDGA